MFQTSNSPASYFQPRSRPYCLLTFRVCRIISKSRTPSTPPAGQEGLLIKLRFGTSASIQVVCRRFPAVVGIVGFNLPRSLRLLDRLSRWEGWKSHTSMHAVFNVALILVYYRFGYQFKFSSSQLTNTSTINISFT